MMPRLAGHERSIPLSAQCARLGIRSIIGWVLAFTICGCAPVPQDRGDVWIIAYPGTECRYERWIGSAKFSELIPCGDVGEMTARYYLPGKAQVRFQIFPMRPKEAPDGRWIVPTEEEEIAALEGFALAVRSLSDAGFPVFELPIM